MYVSICLGMYVCIYVAMYICMYVCMYVYMNVCIYDLNLLLCQVEAWIWWCLCLGYGGQVQKLEGHQKTNFKKGQHSVYWS